MNYMCVCRYILVGVSQPAGCETGAASCDGTQATRISQDTKLVVGWGGGAVWLLFVGMLGGRGGSVVYGECQGVGIIADSILRA